MPRPAKDHRLKWRKIGHVDLGAEKIVVRRRPGSLILALSLLDEHGVERVWVQMLPRDAEDLKNLLERADSAR
jgi:hypothetical protein